MGNYKSKLWWAVLLMVGQSAVGCGETDELSAADDLRAADQPLLRSYEGDEQYSSLDDWLTELANDYLFKKATREEKAVLLEDIHSLTPDETKRFHQIVIERSGVTGNERASAEIAAAYMEKNGIKLMEMRHEEHGRELAELILAGLTYSEDRAGEQYQRLACGITEVSCDYVTSWNSALANGSCTPPGCVTGTYSDRVGNTPCEIGACDYRVRFTKTGATQIDGVGLAADCVLLYYSAITSYSAGSYTYGGIGQGGIIACFLSTSSIHTNFVVW